MDIKIEASKDKSPIRGLKIEGWAFEERGTCDGDDEDTLLGYMRRGGR